MFKLLLFLFLIIMIIYCIKSHIRIKWRTFLKKGFKPNRGKFGVYCYCGKQGSGKTYSVVEYLRSVPHEKKIYANISSLNGIDYTYFSGFDELLALRNESNCVIVYDEIFTALTRTSRINTEVLERLEKLKDELADMEVMVKEDMTDDELRDEDIFRINEKIKDLEQQILNVVEG